jgi:hypothetical protein
MSDTQPALGRFLVSMDSLFMADNIGDSRFQPAPCQLFPNSSVPECGLRWHKNITGYYYLLLQFILVMTDDITKLGAQT